MEQQRRLPNRIHKGPHPAGRGSVPSHDEKIASRVGRPAMGAPVLIVDARRKPEEYERGRVVGMRSAALDVTTHDGETPHSATHYVVLYIVLFADGSAMPFTENEVQLWSPPLIARPGQIQPAQLIVSPRDAK